MLVAWICGKVETPPTGLDLLVSEEFGIKLGYNTWTLMEVLVLVCNGPRFQNHEQFLSASVGPPPTVFGKNRKTQVASALRYEVPLSDERSWK